MSVSLSISDSLIRNQCQHCRLKKCFKMGMKREGKTEILKYFRPPDFKICFSTSCAERPSARARAARHVWLWVRSGSLRWDNLLIFLHLSPPQSWTLRHQIRPGGFCPQTRSFSKSFFFNDPRFFPNFPNFDIYENFSPVSSYGWLKDQLLTRRFRWLQTTWSASTTSASSPPGSSSALWSGPGTFQVVSRATLKISIN